MFRITEAYLLKDGNIRVIIDSLHIGEHGEVCDEEYEITVGLNELGTREQMINLFKSKINDICYTSLVASTLIGMEWS